MDFHLDIRWISHVKSLLILGLGVTSKMPERRVPLLLRLRQELKNQLSDLAKHEHRSLNQQIEFILERFLSDKNSKPRNDELGDGRPGKTGKTG